MAVYCVCFELTADLRESRAAIREVFGDVPAILARLGPALQVSASACLVACELTAAQVMEQLWQQVLAHGERVLVLPIAQDAPWRLHGWETDEVVARWLCEHLSR